MANDIAQVIMDIPPVTRVMVLTTVAMFVISMTMVIPIFHFVNYTPFTFGKLQLWRLFTAFFIPQGDVFSQLMDIYILYTYSSKLEREKFRSSRADYVWYMTVVCSIMLILNYFTGGVAYLEPLTLAMAYTWAQDHIGTRVTFFFFQVKAQLLPVLRLALMCLLGGQMGFLIGATGYVAAHFYLFFDTIWPLRGGRNILVTPSFLQDWLPDGPGAQMGFGTAYRPAQRSAGSSSSSSGSSSGGGFTSAFSGRFQGKGRRLGK